MVGKGYYYVLYKLKKGFINLTNNFYINEQSKKFIVFL